MFSTKVLQTALVALKRIQEGEYEEVCGICYNMSDRNGGKVNQFLAAKIVAHYAKPWPHYSGDKDYPVPHIEMTPEEAYNEDTKHMWDKSHPYGSLRWDLLEHIIECIKEDLKNA